MGPAENESNTSFPVANARGPAEETMAATVEVLEAQALCLTTSERARLIQRLIASLHVDPTLEEAWIAEAERRSAEIDQGTARLIPLEDALAKLKAEYG